MFYSHASCDTGKVDFRNQMHCRALPHCNLRLTLSQAPCQNFNIIPNWVDWCVYIVNGVTMTAKSQVKLIKNLRNLMQAIKQRLRSELPRICSLELLNNLYRYPYTKIEFLEKDLGVSRITAAKHMDALAAKGFVEKRKIGRTNFYVNQPLYSLLTIISLGDE